MGRSLLGDRGSMWDQESDLTVLEKGPLSGDTQVLEHLGMVSLD